MTLQVLPFNFENGVPADRILFDAVQAFCEKEFGQKVRFDKNIKTWAVVKSSEDGEGFEVIGLTSLAYALDCPVFHVAASDDDAGREEARKVRDMLMGRASTFIQDYAGLGTEVLVYVKPETERFWKGYLRLIGAKLSNRFIVKV